MSPTRPERERMVVEALDCLILAGEFGRAAALGDEVRGFAHEVCRCYGLGRLTLLAADDAGAEQLLNAAWDRCDPRSDPPLAARIAANLAMVSARSGRAAAAAEWGQRALVCDPDASTAGLPRTTLALGLAASGRASDAFSILAALPDDPVHVGPEEADGLLGRGIARLWTDDLAGARADLSIVVAACRARGPFHIGLLGLLYLADAEYRLGEWDDAVIHGELAASQADDSEEAWARGLTHAVASFTLAARGDREPARAHAEVAWEAIVGGGDLGNLLWAGVARGGAALAERDYEGAAVALEPVLGLVSIPPDADEPNIQPWRELYAEALVGLGRLEEAEDALRPLEALAAERGRHSSLAGAARVRGLLEVARGRPSAAREAFEAGMGHAAHVEMPFSRARLEDAYGRLLRRGGERRRAAERLVSAHQTYLRLGARPYLEAVERELAACGLTPAPRSAPRHLHLTPQELAVARLVVEGKTNREVAAELVVSPKTVGYHLGNVYAKLGVSSRAQLAAHSPPPRPDPPGDQ